MANIKDGLGVATKELGAFKKFISRGNVIDMAVGVIIGGAFGKIVTSLVNDIVMPLIGLALGKVNFAGLSVRIGEAEIKYGNFIQKPIQRKKKKQNLKKLQQSLNLTRLFFWKKFGTY